MTICVDGIGPRKRFWITRNINRPRLGPFFHSLEGLAWGLCHYGRLSYVHDLKCLENCINGEFPRYRFTVRYTGVATGPHREKHCDNRAPKELPQEAPLDPDIQELLDLVRPPFQEEPSAKAKLEDALREVREGCSRADDEFRKADLTGFSTVDIYRRIESCQKLDLSGDFSWSSFADAHLNRNFHTFDQAELVLSGWFIGAVFRNSEIDDARLCGDFSYADFLKARFMSCELSGNFNRALMSEVSLTQCTINPKASFNGADLRGAAGLFCSEKQIMSAQILSKDRIVVKTGNTITLLNRGYELCQPAQFLNTVIISDAKRDPVEPPRTRISASLLDGDPSQDELSDQALLYDVAGMGLTRLDGWPTPGFPSKNKRGVVFYLNAPGVTMVAFDASRRTVCLAGHFDQACLTESQVDCLSLHEGSFRDFDLTDADVKRLDLRVDRTDLAGLRFPISLKLVELRWFWHGSEFTLKVKTALAPKIIAAWKSRAECAGLAIEILSRVKAVSLAEKQQMLKSRARTVGRLLKDYRQPHGNLAIAAGLLAHRNQI